MEHRVIATPEYARGARERDDELAPMSGAVASSVDPSTMQRDDLPRDAQTDAEAGGFMRPHL
jgi:hypothetical protein